MKRYVLAVLMLALMAAPALAEEKRKVASVIHMGIANDVFGTPLIVVYQFDETGAVRRCKLTEKASSITCDQWINPQQPN
jgi:hypothetical protein